MSKEQNNIFWVNIEIYQNIALSDSNSDRKISSWTRQRIRRKFCVCVVKIFIHEAKQAKKVVWTIDHHFRSLWLFYDTKSIYITVCDFLNIIPSKNRIFTSWIPIAQKFFFSHEKVHKLIHTNIKFKNWVDKW